MNIIGGKYRGKKLLIPSSETTRPTSQRAREALMSVIESKYGRFNVIIEPFAGSGAFSFECISRQITQRALLIEKDVVCLSVLRKNLLSFPDKLDVNLIEKDCLLYSSYPVDLGLYFIDPPYDLSNSIIPKALDKLSDIHENCLIICEVEVGQELPFIPDQFTIIDDRKYGRARFLFLRKIS